MLGPIFNREWLTVPRRSRHYVNRAANLGLLWVLGVAAWQMTVGWTNTASLGEAARFGSGEPVIFLHTGGLPALFA